MRILVTGVTGRVGANLAKALVEKGHEVRGLVKPGEPTGKLGTLRMELVVCDLADAEGVARAAKGVEAVYHLGAVMGGYDDRTTYETNVHGTFNMLEAARVGCPDLTRFVFATTDASVPHSGFIPEIIPEDAGHVVGGMYTVSKECGEILCRDAQQRHKLPVVITRFAFIVGAGELLDRGYFRGLRLDDYRGRCDSVTPRTREEEEAVRAFRTLEASREERWFLPRTMDGIAYKKHIADVRDVVDGLVRILEHDAAVGRSMDLMGCPLKWEEAIPYLSERTGVPYVEARLPTTPMYYEFSLEMAREVLGFVPKYDTTAMIDDTLAFQRGEDIGVIPSG